MGPTHSGMCRGRSPSPRTLPTARRSESFSPRCEQLFAPRCWRSCSKPTRSNRSADRTQWPRSRRRRSRICSRHVRSWRVDIARSLRPWPSFPTRSPQYAAHSTDYTRSLAKTGPRINSASQRSANATGHPRWQRISLPIACGRSYVRICDPRHRPNRRVMRGPAPGTSGCHPRQIAGSRRCSQTAPARVLGRAMRSVCARRRASRPSQAGHTGSAQERGHGVREAAPHRRTTLFAAGSWRRATLRASRGSDQRIAELQRAGLEEALALSRNVCAHPTCEVRLADPSWPYVQCEFAHISDCRRRPTVRRRMSDGERNSYGI